MRADVVSFARVQVGLLLVLGLVSSAAAQTAAPNAASLQRGKRTFMQSCAVCHGDRGNGKASAASALTSRPTDLTVLSRRQGTTVAEIVERAIKGQDPVVAHGSPSMMVWGTVFLAQANGDQAAADARIRDVARYIESIQVKSR